METDVVKLNHITDYQAWSYSILSSLKAIDTRFEMYLDGTLPEEELKNFREPDIMANLIRSSISQEMHEKAQVYEKPAKEIWEYFKNLHIDYKRAHFLYMKDIIKILSNTSITSESKLNLLIDMGENIFEVLDMDIGKEYVSYSGDSVAVTAYNMLANSDVPTSLTNIKSQMIILRHIADAESLGRCAKCGEKDHNFLTCQKYSWQTKDHVSLPSPPSTNFAFRPLRN